MYMHQVFIKPKEGILPSQLEYMCSNVGLLLGIPGVISATASPNLSSERTNGFTYGITVILDRKESLEPYKHHPNHKLFAERFVHPIRDDNQVFDQEI